MPNLQTPINNLTAIGIDIDGTITLDPDFYSVFTRECKQNGIVIHVVSARPSESLFDTEDELQELGITYDELYLLPSLEEAITICPHSEIEVFHRHFWLKVDYALRQGLTHFVDDNERILQLFRIYAPKIQLVHSVDYPLLSNLIECF